jgi:AbrB family looped-hinge helix DNA binding protein
MGRETATVSSKGQLVIPVRLREDLGITAGTRVSFKREGNVLILQPATEVAARTAIEQLAGMTAGGYSMADHLVQERRKEDEEAGW